jgi:predicted ABC-type ATPase
VADPLLHIIVGPNGAGKTTFYERVIKPIPLEFVNADVIAAQQWPGQEVDRGYDAAQLAAARRSALFEQRRSFATETVFSHESKVDLIRDAATYGYIVVLNIILIPEDLAVARVRNRVHNGGHDVPEHKIRARHNRLWTHVSAAIQIATASYVYDNSSASSPFTEVAAYTQGMELYPPRWPPWSPSALRNTNDSPS